jgi:hypothetical protein
MTTKPISDPSHIWNMVETPEFEEAKLSMTIGMRDWAETPEEIEIYAHLGAFLQSPWFLEFVTLQRRLYAARRQGQPKEESHDDS